MKYFTRINLISFILFNFISFIVSGQTNVSGGIYTNSTWTLANSPYIVTDTIVVFPNVVLTIEPGVTVKFADNKLIEIRQGKLLAIGTSVDSIRFTSNSSLPSEGIYPGIFLNGGSLTSIFNYCNFSFASIAISVAVSDSIIVNNSNFNQNITGLQFKNSLAGIIMIDKSIFFDNTNGLILVKLSQAIVSNCNFSYNINDGFILGDPNSTSSSFFAVTSNCIFSNDSIGLMLDLENSILDHCHFSNNNMGFYGSTDQGNYVHIYPNIVKNCIFDFNQTGLKTDHILIDSCMIVHNQTGYLAHGVSRIKNCIVDSNSVLGLSTFNDSVVNCIIKYNGGGISSNSYTAIIGNDIEYNPVVNINSSTFQTIITGNTIRYSNIGINNITGSFNITSNIIDNNDTGIILNSSNGTISCNSICNNTTYELIYGAPGNLDASHNFWCYHDSASLEAMIYDGYDNISYGLVSFLPFDSICPPGTTISVNEITQGGFLFSIYPNPAEDYISVNLPVKVSKAEIKILNMLGDIEFSELMSFPFRKIDISAFANGIKIIEVTVDKKVSRLKFIKR